MRNDRWAVKQVVVAGRPNFNIICKVFPFFRCFYLRLWSIVLWLPLINPLQPWQNHLLLKNVNSTCTTTSFLIWTLYTLFSYLTTHGLLRRPLITTPNDISPPGGSVKSPRLQAVTLLNESWSRAQSHTLWQNQFEVMLLVPKANQVSGGILSKRG